MLKLHNLSDLLQVIYLRDRIKILLSSKGTIIKLKYKIHFIHLIKLIESFFYRKMEGSSN